MTGVLFEMERIHVDTNLLSVVQLYLCNWVQVFSHGRSHSSSLLFEGVISYVITSYLDDSGNL